MNVFVQQKTHSFRSFLERKRIDMMVHKDLLSRITVNPQVMVGKPTIRGLRITVEQILRALAGGVSHKDLLDDYPQLESEDIEAALLYAVELVEEEQVLPIKVPA